MSDDNWKEEIIRYLKEIERLIKTGSREVE